MTVCGMVEACKGSLLVNSWLRPKLQMCLGAGAQPQAGHVCLDCRCSLMYCTVVSLIRQPSHMHTHVHAYARRSFPSRKRDRSKAGGGAASKHGRPSAPQAKPQGADRCSLRELSIFVDIHTGISISKIQTASVLVKPVITKNGGVHKYMHEMNN